MHYKLIKYLENPQNAESILRNYFAKQMALASLRGDYPGALDYPTNEIKYDNVYGITNNYQIIEQTPYQDKHLTDNRGAIISVGPELGFYYGNIFNASVLVNIDINKQLSTLLHPFLIYISLCERSKADHYDEIVNYFEYISLIKRIDSHIPSKEEVHLRNDNLLQDLTYEEYQKRREWVRHQSQQAIKDPKYQFIHRFFALCEHITHFQYRNNPDIFKDYFMLDYALTSYLKWPTFQEGVFSYINKLAKEGKIASLHGNILSRDTIHVVNEIIGNEPVKVIYISNIIHYLDENEISTLFKTLKDLDPSEEATIILSLIEFNLSITSKDLTISFLENLRSKREIIQTQIEMIEQKHLQ
ncbi:MAG: hypothetical protein WC838_03015 [Candidatus Margulisiibacteriota bacterium]|jgi:hypothetical protein